MCHLGLAPLQQHFAPALSRRILPKRLQTSQKRLLRHLCDALFDDLAIPLEFTDHKRPRRNPGCDLLALVGPVAGPLSEAS